MEGSCLTRHFVCWQSASFQESHPLGDLISIVFKLLQLPSHGFLTLNFPVSQLFSFQYLQQGGNVHAGDFIDS